ncbi:MAG TPA: hypothetical protein VFA45_22620 [Actinomycetes bacterium]|jgi:hypothetical protein|nr:hypothetical protein [Actinomycetes bacterium]
MDSTVTDDRPLYRLGGAMAIGGALLEFVGNALHPRSVSYYGDPVAWLNNATRSSQWFPSHVLILLGSILLIGGLVALSRSLTGTRGHGIGQVALANALIGSSLILVTLAIDGLTVAELDQAWRVGPAPSPEALLAGSILYHTIFSLLYVFELTLFGLAPILYGVAILLSKAYATWLGWVGMLIGSSVVLTALLSMIGVATEFIDAVVWSVVASLFVLWVLVMGVLLWRKSQGLTGLRT